MAVDMFLVISTVKGETQDSTYSSQGGIDVLAWSWGASNSGTAHVGSGSGSGKATANDITITKYVDSSSTSLWKACANGDHFATANLYIRKAGTTPLVYLTFAMTEVLITSISTGGTGSQDMLTENVTLNFAEIKMAYTMQNKDGTSGASTNLDWNIQQNTVS